MENGMVTFCFAGMVTVSFSNFTHVPMCFCSCDLDVRENVPWLLLVPSAPYMLTVIGLFPRLFTIIPAPTLWPDGISKLNCLSYGCAGITENSASAEWIGNNVSISPVNPVRKCKIVAVFFMGQIMGRMLGCCLQWCM